MDAAPTKGGVPQVLPQFWVAQYACYAAVVLRKFTDDMGRDVALAGPPKRIVSLVPSETETLFAIGAGERVVGRTKYCELPADGVAAIPTVGGTKDVDVDAVCELAPDIVFANQEENARPGLEALANRGVRVFVSFPRRVADGVALVARIARVCGVDREEAAKRIVLEGYRALKAAEERTAEREDWLAVFAPIWLEPLMTFSAQTFGSDMLRLAGARNIFEDRERKYPLKADLGLRSPLAADRAAHRDIRYPRVTADEVNERKPEAVLLADEPYAFSEAERAAMSEQFAPASLLCGKDLFWYGARIPAAIERLTALVRQLRTPEAQS